MAATLYTPQVPAANAFSNLDLNSLASTYAATFGHSTTALIQRIVNHLIYDAAPQQFFDLKILNMKAPKNVPSDEFFYHEMGFGRDPIQHIAADVVAGGASQIITLLAGHVNRISVDTIIVYTNNTKGTITNVNIGANQITVTAMSGGALPALAGSEIFANLSPVEADGANSISQYFRVDTVERFNFVQMLVKAMRFGRMELFKYQNAGTTSNYLSMQKMRCIQQYRIDLSNIYWNGDRGEVTLASGVKAKTAGGVFPQMVAAGSPNTTATLVNLPAAVEDIALASEFKAYGATRFLYGTPRLIHNLSQQYKRSLTRYTPSDDMAKLGLKGVDMSSSFIVFVPIKRFEERSCFPAAFENRLILLDQESIQPVQTWGEEMGETLQRVNEGTLQNFTDYWISGTFSMEFQNPLGSGYIQVI